MDKISRIWERKSDTENWYTEERKDPGGLGRETETGSRAQKTNTGVAKMSETESLGSGREVIRDETTGRFKRVKLAPEVASEMGKARWSGESSAERLLLEQGYNQTDNRAPEYIVVMAQQAVKHPAAMSHWRRVHALSDQSSETGGLKRPRHNEQCALCGHWNFYAQDGRIFSELARMLRAIDVEAEA